MRIDTKTDKAPELKKINTKYSIEYKSKTGEFVIKDKEDGWKEVARQKSIKFVPIADERFTLKFAYGSPYFTESYRSTKQTMTVFGGIKPIHGTYSELKVNPDTAEGKFQKIMHLLVEVNNKFETAEFRYSGVAVKMFGDLNLKQEGVLELKSEDAASFESRNGKLFKLNISNIGNEDEITSKIADEFAAHVTECYESQDTRYKYYRDAIKNKSEDAIDYSSITPESLDNVDDDFDNF